MAKDCIKCIHYNICSRLGGVGLDNCKEYLAISNKNNNFIELPCSVGQTLYYIDRYRDRIETDTVKFFTITKNGINTILQYHNQKFWDYHELGKTVFLSEEDAQKAFAKETTDV